MKEDEILIKKIQYRDATAEDLIVFLEQFPSETTTLETCFCIYYKYNDVFFNTKTGEFRLVKESKK